MQGLNSGIVHGRSQEIARGRGATKAKVFKGKNDTKLTFIQRWKGKEEERG